MQTPFDENLIIALAKGNKMALAPIYEEAKSTVYGFALSILKNKADAEDIMHDTYIRMFQNASSYQPQGKPLAWLLIITKRLAYNRLRDEKYPEELSVHDKAAGDGAEDSDDDEDNDEEDDD